MMLSAILKGRFYLLIGFLLMISCPSQGILHAQNVVHRVMPNETCYGIAKKYGITEAELYQLNPGLQQNGLKAGATIRIPDGKYPKDDLPKLITLKSATEIIQHQIEKGETLYGIAKKYHTTEAEIIKMNKGLSESNFPLGKIIYIPLVKAHSTPTPIPVATSVAKGSKNNVGTRQPYPQKLVKVALILPISQYPSKYGYFYKGFLLALDELKHFGISAEINVYDIQSLDKINTLISSGVLNNQDLIIGGVQLNAIKCLSAFSAEKKIPYVIPFNGSSDIPDVYPYTFMINPDKKFLYKKAIAAFYKFNQHRKIVIVKIPGDKEEKGFLPLLMKDLIRNKANSTLVDLKDLPFYLSPGCVVIPTSPSSQSIEKLRPIISNRGVILFGFPSWLMLSAKTFEGFGSTNVSFFCPFELNSQMDEVKKYEANYLNWYGSGIMKRYPDYSVLGYDIARFFIRSLYNYPDNFIKVVQTLPSDGLQMDFSFENLSGSNSTFTNTSLYMITYTQRGRYRQAIK